VFKLLAAFCVTFAVSSNAYGAEATLKLSGLEYPEGVLVHDGAVYFTEMDANRIMASVNGGPFAQVWSEAGCGPTSIAPLDKSRFLINCHMTGGLRIWNSAANTTVRAPEPSSRAIQRPNDSASDGASGVFFTDSGEFSTSTRHSGVVGYFDGEGYRFIASGLHYANGVAYDADARTLYVSEHLGRRILKIVDPLNGSPKREVFWDYTQKPCAQTGADAWLFGPDGLELRPGGGLFVAMYGGEAVYELDANGECGRVHSIPAMLVTSSALDAKTRTLWVVSGALREKPSEGGLFQIEIGAGGR